MLYIILALIIILCPVPIKFRLEYVDKKLKIYIFKKQISLDKIKNKKKISNNKKNKNSKEYLKSFHKLKFNKIFMPTLRINFDLQYGFEDAAFTALCYGFINSLIPFIHRFLCNFFKMKKFKFNVNPLFNKEIIVFKINSIIFVNLVKVIYIILKIFLFTKIKNNKH